MGFGAMRLTGEDIWGNPKDVAECRKVLQRAVELGVNFIDTADSYGPDVSEKLIASALRPYPADVVIATKGGLMRPRPDVWHPNGRPEYLRAACEGSLRRLGVEAIDLYQFHRPDPEVPFEESVGSLVGLRDEGKIRHIGVCNVTIAQLRAAIDMTEIVSVQNRYSLLDRTSEQVLRMCEREDIAFIPWRPLDLGDLSHLSGPIAESASRRGATPVQVALAWLLAHSKVMLPIPGTASLRHLDENVAAAAITLDKQEVIGLGAIPKDDSARAHL
ncbi:MAG: aldo/keto reductase [Candidatus Dormibacteraceae bacterium]